MTTICNHQPHIRADDSVYVFAQCDICHAITVACPSSRMALIRFRDGEYFDYDKLYGEPVEEP